jgi:hypothetical protein
MLMGVTSWELGVLRVPLIMVPDTCHFNPFSLIPKNLVPVEEVTKAESISTISLSLSNGHLDRVSLPLITRVTKTPQGPPYTWCFNPYNAFLGLYIWLSFFLSSKSGAYSKNTSLLMYPLRTALLTFIWYNLIVWAQSYAIKILIASNISTEAYVSPKSRPSTLV